MQLAVYLLIIVVAFGLGCFVGVCLQEKYGGETPAPEEPEQPKR
jgi:uncharacterized protein YneF (UPF0154 family)